MTTLSPTPAPTVHVPQITLSFGLAAFLLSAGAGLLVLVLYYGFRKQVIRKIQDREDIRAVTWFAEPFIAVLLSFVTSFFDIAKPDTWKAPNGSIIFGAPLWTFLVAGYVVLKYATSKAKDKEASEIRELRKDLAQRDSTVEKVTQQRDFLAKLKEFVREPMEAKIRRMVESLKKKPLTHVDYMEALAPNEQVQIILNTIFEFFRTNLEKSAQLRLGVFMREPGSRHLLYPAYSFDGSSRENVFSEFSNHVRIDNPEGTQSLIVQAFLSEKKLHVVSSCEEAVRKGEFHYFRPDQKRYLKSMIAYKHVWQRDGERDGLVLTIDTSADGFFGRFGEEELSPFMLEMMKRMEYEVLGLQFQEALNSKIK